METEVDQLTQRWKESQLKIKPGASAQQLSQFEEQVGTKLRPDIRQYFAAVNGMEENEMDTDHIRFWPLEEVKPLSEDINAPESPEYKGYYLFADYLLWSHIYAVDLSTAGSGSIVMVGGKEPRQVASSFAEFVRLYLDKSEEIF